MSLFRTQEGWKGVKWPCWPPRSLHEANQTKLDKLGTFQKLLKVVDKELSQRRPFGSLQSVDQLLDLGWNSAADWDTCIRTNINMLITSWKCSTDALHSSCSSSREKNKYPAIFETLQWAISRDATATDWPVLESGLFFSFLFLGCRSSKFIGLKSKSRFSGWGLRFKWLRWGDSQKDFRFNHVFAIPTQWHIFHRLTTGASWCCG